MTMLKAPNEAMYLCIQGSLSNAEDKYYNFAYDGKALTIRSVKFKLFRTIITNVLTIPADCILAMEIASDISPYLSVNVKLSPETEAFGFFKTGYWKKKNRFFVIRYNNVKQGSANPCLIFGADYPGQPEINIKFLENLIRAWKIARP
jgi:hypothetical protein